MDNSILDYDESLNDLEQQKKQLELVMQKMGEEWEKSGPGIKWLKMLQNIKEIPTKSTTTMDDKDLTADVTLETNDDLIDILQQQSLRPSPEYVQSLLYINETLLAQSLAASPMIDIDESSASMFKTAIASPQSEEGSLSDVCTPGLNSASSATQSSTPTTPDEENDNVFHHTNGQIDLDHTTPII